MLFSLLLFSQLSLCFQGQRPKIFDETSDDAYTPQDRFNNTKEAINEVRKEFSNLEITNEDGGAINIASQKVNLTLSYCRFSSCKASNGGAIYINYAGSGLLVCNIANTDFLNCQSDKNGGAIYVKITQKDKHSATFEQCLFYQNKAGKNGGAIYAEARDELIINNCIFTGNSISDKNYNGSTIYCIVGWDQGSDPNNSLILTNNHFIFSPDANNGVNVHIQSSKISDENTKENANVYIGGCLFDSTNPDYQDFKHLDIYPISKGFKSINFISCNCVKQSSSTVSVQKKFSISNFNFDCQSLDTCTPGPEIPGKPDEEPSDSSVASSDQEVVLPTSEPDADGYRPSERIEVKSDLSGLKLNKLKFTSLQSSNKGGAVYCERTNISVDDCKFNSNGGSEGGAIYVFLTKVNNEALPICCIINKCEFNECSSGTSNGGAISFKSTQAEIHTVTISDCTFTSNTGKRGGAIYSEQVRDELIIENCIFTNNKATENGSSIWFAFGNSAGKDTNDTLVFINNKFIASPDSVSNVYIKNYKFQDPTSTTPVLNIYIDRCTFSSDDPSNSEYKNLIIEELNGKINSVEFMNCNCFKQGVETVTVPASITLKNIQFECTDIDQCTPGPEIPGKPDEEPSDSSVASSDQEVVLPTSEPDADGYRPSERIEVKSDLSGLKLNKLKFTSLQSSNKGGAVYCERTNISVDDCKFNSNGGSEGGAIYVFLTKVNNEALPICCIINKCEFNECSSGTSNGGAISFKSTQAEIHTVTISDCTFTSNTGKRGGAIYSEQVRDELIIENCIFTNNKATENGSSIWFAFGNSAGKDTNDTLVFINNKFIASPDSVSNVYIKNYKFQDPTSTTPVLNIYIDRCTFSSDDPSNSEYKNLIIEELNGKINSVEFMNCNCFKQGVETVTVPASITLKNIQFECTDIDQCTPGDYEKPTQEPTPPPATPDVDGYIPHDRINDEGVAIELKKNKFTNLGTLEEDGGAILIFGKDKRVNCILDDCKFETCQGKKGGALYIYMADSNYLVFHATDCKFNDCKSATDAGAVYLESVRSKTYNILFSSCSFTANKAERNGGAAYLKVCDNFTMQHCTFENNVAAKNGSSIWCQVGYNQGKDTNNTAIFTDNTFTFTPTADSTNVYIQDYKIVETQGVINAVLFFGMAKFSANGNPDVSYKHFVLYQSEQGFQSINLVDCICVGQGKETVSLPEGVSDEAFTYNCNSFDSCKPSSDGYKPHTRIDDEVRTGPIELEGFKFVGHVFDRYGGAITIEKERTSCTIKNCKFDSCYAVFGGAIYIKYSGTNDTYICTITDTIFSNNEVKTNGGAFYCEITQSKIHKITMTNCSFLSNKAGKNGGAIYAMSRDGFTLERCNFEGNTASGIGYSIWCRVGINNEYNHNEVIMHDNSFIFTPENEKAINVYIEDRALTDDTTPNANLVFGHNIFDIKGQEISGYKHMSVVAPSSFEELNFDQCNCVKQGSDTVSLPFPFNADLYFNFNCQSIDTCQTQKPTPVPTPDKDGYVPSERIELSVATLSLTKTKFTNIVSEKEGGAISLTKTSCSLNDCKFDSCKSTVQSKNGGGAIYISYNGKDGYYECSIVNCIFDKCQASLDGGALNIYISQPKRHSASIEGCTFTGNKAESRGGAIYSVARDLLTIQHCTFNNNEAKNGSSLWVQVGWYEGSDENDRLVLYGNNFNFQPSETNTVNVFITSNNLKEEISPNANVLLGHCTFTASNINGDSQKNLIIAENGTFQSIVFTECNCIQGGQNTVLITAASAPNLNDAFKFDCTNIDQCPSGSEQPPASDECPSYQNRQEIYGKKVKIEKTCFYGLKSSREGGAIRAVNSEIELDKCRFTSCSSENDGGAVYVSFTTKDCELEIEECVFEDCSSGAQGGALFFNNDYAKSESEIKECKFIRNAASSHGGALYYAPCANSKLLNCFFVNNSCKSESSTHGSSIYVLIQNQNGEKSSMRMRTKDDDDDDDDDHKVIIDGNRVRSEPAKDSQQMYINLKKNGQLKLGGNSFSFNGATEKPSNSKYIQIAAEEGAKLSVAGETCVDSIEESGLVSGINSDVKYDCHKADAEFDNVSGNPPEKKKSNVGLIVGIVVAVVVVIVIVIVVVVVCLKRKGRNNYISDLGNDYNDSAAINNEAEFAT